jgi:3-isopropylmalate dehydrogenase
MSEHPGSNGHASLVFPRGSAHNWSDRIFVRPEAPRPVGTPFTIGVVEGEGIGPEVIRASLAVLAALESSAPWRFQTRTSKEPIGSEAEARSGTALSEAVVGFCQEIFSDRGAVLAGPGGGRFVYELRRHFDLFCKLSPLKPSSELSAVNRLKPEHTRDVDVLVVRENVSGVYQSLGRDVRTADGGRRVEHASCYTDAEVRRILQVAVLLASDRRGEMTVVVKDGGMPALSSLWRDCTRDAAAGTGVTYRFANVDLAAYLLVQHARGIDVLVAPNLFGDVLADVGAVLLGSRGLSYSGNFSGDGAAVYQTNHGGALDLAGTDRANPVGQIYSLAMLLRESFGLAEAASVIEAAVAEVWRQGWRTEDVAEPGCRLVGTRDMAARIAEAAARLSVQRLRDPIGISGRCHQEA